MNILSNFSYIFDILKSENISGEVLKDEPMSLHTSFKTGGPADVFVSPADENELKKVIEILKKENAPAFVIGNGTNLLVKDNGIRGVVVHIGKGFSYINTKNEEITAGAGCLMSEIAQNALDNSLTGFEFASGIPGSFGGGMFMNAGAYDGEMKNVLKAAKVLDRNTLEIFEISAEELDLGYRKSSVEAKGYIVLEGTIKLGKGDYDKIKDKMNDLNSQRREKQPLTFPSAGSTFKRPEGYFAGKLISDSGLKGFSVGGAQVSEKHAGFVINKGNATTADILSVIKHCQETVFDNYGVMLETEVRILGE